MRLPSFARAALILLPLSGCGALQIFAPQHVVRGALFDPDSLKELIPGTSSRADATSLLGSPTAKATFDDNTWIYIAQVTSTRIGRTPGVTTQRVTVLKFNQAGTLTDIQQLGLADSKTVAMASGATPSPGSSASFMQQLLGNVGKFTPAGLPGGLGGSHGGLTTNAGQ